MKEAGWGDGDLSIGLGGGGGEEVEFLAGAGAGNVKEALVLGGLAIATEAIEPTGEGISVLTLGCDGCEHDVRGAPVGGAG
jgi:hypothetical protein